MFLDGALVGLVMQKGDQLVECVPVPLIRTFLEGVRNSCAPEVPGLGFTPYAYQHGLYVLDPEWTATERLLARHWRDYLEGRSSMDAAPSGS